MRLSSLHLTDFRNYESLSLDLPPEGALFCGLNGSGKTNVLEAIHLLCLGRSQRGATRTEMIRHGREVATLDGRFSGPDSPAQTIAHMGFSRDKRVSLSLDGAKVQSLREWFSHAALVSFGPDDLHLISGPAGLRRRFLDMLICQVDGQYLDHLAEYQKALQNRNRLLAGAEDATLLELYEAAMVQHGLYLCAKRAEILSYCRPAFEACHAEISGGREQGSYAYRPSVSLPEAGSTQGGEVFSSLLRTKRKQDAALGHTTIGPHRDEIVFLLDGRHARPVASQGQCRSLALSLRLASVACIEGHKNDSMIFLVDDAFSELDDLRVSYLYPLLRGKGQVFMTTPSERLAVEADLPRYRVGGGAVAAQDRAGVAVAHA